MDQSKIAQKIRFKEPQYRLCDKPGHNQQQLQYVFKDKSGQFYLHCQSCIEQLPHKIQTINLETIQLEIQSTSVQNFQQTYFEFEKMDSFIGKIANQFIQIAEQLTNYKSNFKKKWKAQLNHLIDNQQKLFEQRLDDVLQSQTDCKTQEEMLIQQSDFSQALGFLNTLIKKDDKKYFLKMEDVNDFLLKSKEQLCNDELKNLFNQLTSINENIVSEIEQIKPENKQFNLQDMNQTIQQNKQQMKLMQNQLILQASTSVQGTNDTESIYKQQYNGDSNNNSGNINTSNYYMKQKYKKKPEQQIQKPKILLKELQQSLQNHTQSNNNSYLQKQLQDSLKSKYIKKPVKQSKKMQKINYKQEKKKEKYTKDFEQEFDDSEDFTQDAKNQKNKRKNNRDLEEEIYEEQDGTHSHLDSRSNKKIDIEDDSQVQFLKYSNGEINTDQNNQNIKQSEKQFQKNKSKQLEDDEDEEDDDEDEDEVDENEVDSDSNDRRAQNLSSSDENSSDSNIPLNCSAEKCIMKHEDTNWLICHQCKKSYHSNCLELNFWLAQTNTADGKFWRCKDCKNCYNCDESMGDTLNSAESRICKLCDKAFHQKCLTKKERINKEGNYWLCLDCRKCPNCLECKRCKDNLECNNKKTQCNNVIWNNMTKEKWEIAKERKRNCDKCWERHQKKYLADNSYDYCFFCMKIHKKGSSKSCVCHNCNSWVHTRCDSKADEFYKQYKKVAKKYICPQCNLYEEKQNILQVQKLEKEKNI